MGKVGTAQDQGNGWVGGGLSHGLTEGQAGVLGLVVICLGQRGTWKVR